MSTFTYSHGPWYENEGPTPKEMRQDVKDYFVKSWSGSSHFNLIAKPYLYLKIIYENIDKWETPLVSWRMWGQMKGDNFF